jgi:hypothetical protein
VHKLKSNNKEYEHEKPSYNGHSALMRGVNARTGETYEFVSRLTFSTARMARMLFGDMVVKWPVHSLRDGEFCDQFLNMPIEQQAIFKQMPTKKGG